MDGNKDEAARCVRIAEAALASGDKQKALKFLRIAKRLDDTLPIDALLAASESLDRPNCPVREEQVQRNRTRVEPASSNTSESSNGGRSYNEDHVELIREIRKHKDYYGILGVEKTCSVEEIRRAYRKLSLKVHPDKNKAPGAEEAFKAVSKAFKCLSEEESRLQYDRNGFIEDDELYRQQDNIRRRRRRATRYDYEEFDPDDIFRAFFGSQGDVYRTHRARATAAQQRQHTVGADGFKFITLVHVLIILLFILFAYLPFSEPQYSLQRTYNYGIPRATKEHGVEYFVKSEEFDQKYPLGSTVRDTFENDVLRDYKSVLGRYCHMELQRRQWARNYPTPHCDKLRSFEVV